MKKIILGLIISALAVINVFAFDQTEYDNAKANISAKYVKIIDNLAEKTYKEWVDKVEKKISAMKKLEIVYSKKIQNKKNKLYYNIVKYLRLAFEKKLNDAENAKKATEKKVINKEVSKIEDHTFQIIDYNINKSSWYFYEYSSGSAVLFEKNKFLTNAHVVSKEDGSISKSLVACENTSFETAPKCKYLVKVIGFDEKKDIALLEIINNEDIYGNTVNLIPNISFKDKKVALEEEVKIYGFPWIGGESITLTKGIVSGITSRWIKTDASMDHGNSWGPALNKDNEIIGLSYLISSDNSTIGYIIPTKKIKEFLDKAEEPKDNTLKNYSILKNQISINNKIKFDKADDITLRWAKIKKLHESEETKVSINSWKYSDYVSIDNENYGISIELNEVFKSNVRSEKNFNREFYQAFEGLYLWDKEVNDACELDSQNKIFICTDEDNEDALILRNINAKVSIEVKIYSEELTKKEKEEKLREYYKNIEINREIKNSDVKNIKFGNAYLLKEVYDKYYVVNSTDNSFNEVINLLDKKSRENDYSALMIKFTNYKDLWISTIDRDKITQKEFIASIKKGLKELLGDNLEEKTTEEWNKYLAFGPINIFIGKEWNIVLILRSTGMPDYEWRLAGYAEAVIYRYLKLGKDF